MPSGPRNQRLNIFLFKDGTTREQVLRDDVGQLAVAPIAAELDFKGKIITKGTPPNPPRWRQFVQSGTDQPLGPLLNQSASCLIVLSAQGRVFAVSFGFARYWIEETRIVRRFGMIVTLITQAAGGLRQALPFFSKQSLANAARELLNMGYRVRLKKITVRGDAA